MTGNQKQFIIIIYLCMLNLSLKSIIIDSDRNTLADRSLGILKYSYLICSNILIYCKISIKYQ